ncbi:flagellar hook-length control protein FliK [Aeromonas enteropelogenes]|uniref:flagellar hook-length control protein FliK n=1 Tax=Aeromonas enteropelogenes TaxID=29489 RepID=UPI000F537B55|nr:flagellar hook-length control protein FliK [Aeromonas enteropelogenes]RQM58748.1 flagellar hook-length control protein FliK [Aeromonas enteropelogenes]
MMQTVLTQAPSTLTNGLENASLNGVAETGGSDGGNPSGQRGDFATEIAKVQGTGSAPERVKSAPEASSSQTAKSLATDEVSSEVEAAGSDKPAKSDKSDTKAEDLPASDFLLRLQDSLKLDTTLVTAPAVPLPAQVVAEQDAAIDPTFVANGNLLPQEGEGDVLADNDRRSSSAGKLAQTLMAQGGETSLPASSATPMPSVSSALTEGSQPTASLADEAEAVQSKIAPADEGKAVLADAVLEGEDDKVSLKDDPRLSGAVKGDKPLSAQDRLAQLAGRLPGEEQTPPLKQGEAVQGKEGEESKSKPDIPPMASKVSPGQGAHLQGPAAAARAFGEGIKQPDASVQASASEARSKGEEPAQSGQQAAPANSASSDASAAKAASANAAVQSSPVAAGDAGTTPPVMTAPQQALAQAQPQGPQAPLSTISAGIQQMEVTGSSELRKAMAQEVKQKVAEASKSRPGAASASTGNDAQSVQPGQGSQPQPQVTESKGPTMPEAGVRREPQSLPHLNLASKDAPAELHQKVNVMLADKLQQAEIQLDPLGLGKMKIQIQIGADSQANVHFVVQHGQTREMLEQTIPRLREMLAGQGIQLGQTQVQQQAPQQGQQGQQGFSGQGQQGQQSGQSGASEGQGGVEVASSGRSLLAESTNGSGIDFYA